MASSSAPLPQDEPQQPAVKNLRGQLAEAARSISWTYAIFWSISSSHPGVLTWKDGFYNGDIKTRRITNLLELTSNQLIMQRSEQLHELYQSLLSSKCGHRVVRPMASLAPEDLTDTEWYYMICMTYAFQSGQGLPGRSFASNEHVWLCNAHFADSKTFLRALLAKSSAIKTIVCIPLLGGVLELGTTSSVPENRDLVNLVSTSFKDLPHPTCIDVPSAKLTEQTDDVIALLDDLDENAMETMIAEGRHELGEVDVLIHDLDENAVETMIAEGRHELDEVDCMFNTNNLEQITKEYDDFYGLWEELEVQPLENSRIMDDPSLVVAPVAMDSATESEPADSSRVTSFMPWRRPGSDELAVPVVGEPQKLLKKVVSGGAWRITQESDIRNRVMIERRRREKLNEMFLILKSLVPTIRKADRASILSETIVYLKELQQKVQELESSRKPVSSPDGETTMIMCPDNGIAGNEVSAAKRKKATELSGNMEREHHWVLSEDSASNVVSVSIVGAEVLVQVQCRWKELLMARVFDAIRNLHLDVLSVQASTPDGLLVLKMQAQFVSSATCAPGIIRDAIQEAISKS